MQEEGKNQKKRQKRFFIHDSTQMGLRAFGDEAHMIKPSRAHFC